MLYGDAGGCGVENERRGHSDMKTVNYLPDKIGDTIRIASLAV